MNGAKDSPQQTRAQDRTFVQECSLTKLCQQLPLSWPTPAGLPASPKKRYRSGYHYPWGEVCRNPEQAQAWLDLGDFDLALRLVDFSAQAALSCRQRSSREAVCRSSATTASTSA